ncbi:hypothetical protein Hanom_Chr05g00462691 [Helianthus anomalus]
MFSHHMFSYHMFNLNEEQGLCLCSFILVKRTESLVCVCSFTKRTNTNELPGRTVHGPFAESFVHLQPYIQSLKYVCMPKSGCGLIEPILKNKLPLDPLPNPFGEMFEVSS